MSEFLRLYKQEVGFGIDKFENCMLIADGLKVEYGDPEWDDDFYVSFTHEIFDKECELEEGGVGKLFTAFKVII